MGTADKTVINLRRPIVYTGKGKMIKDSKLPYTLKLKLAKPIMRYRY
jgi:hypothetical protein